MIGNEKPCQNTATFMVFARTQDVHLEVALAAIAEIPTNRALCTQHAGVMLREAVAVTAKELHHSIIVLCDWGCCKP